MKIDLNKYKVFFFDFDGVIVDSLDIKTEAFGELFSKYGKGISMKVMDYHRNNGGISRYEKFKYFYNNIINKRINRKIIEQLDRRFSRLVFDKVVKAHFIKGATSFLMKLKKQNKMCFVISATPQREIRHIVKLKKLENVFKDVIGSPRSKEENLKNMLKRYMISAKEALYFGDANSDYEAARKNHIDFIGIVNLKSRELGNCKNILKIKDFRAIVVG